LIIDNGKLRIKNLQRKIIKNEIVNIVEFKKGVLKN
jgi:hypothetical protein